MIFVFANFAFAKTSAENDGLRADAKSAKDSVVSITMTLSISNTAQMQKLLRSLRSVQGVTDVYRSVI